MAPRFDQPIPDSVVRKKVKFTPSPDYQFQNFNVYVYEAPIEAGLNPENPNDSGLSGDIHGFLNLINTKIQDNATLNITLLPSKELPNGIIKSIKLGSGAKPLESVFTSQNPLSWIANTENIEIYTIDRPFPDDKKIRYFAFSSVHEITDTDVEEQNYEIEEKIYYVSKYDPIYDTTDITNTEPIGYRISLSNILESLLKNTDGSILQIKYFNILIAPTNAKYMAINNAGFRVHKNISMRGIAKGETAEVEIPKIRNKIGYEDSEVIEQMKQVYRDYPTTEEYLDIAHSIQVNDIARTYRWVSQGAGELHNMRRVKDEMTSNMVGSVIGVGHFAPHAQFQKTDTSVESKKSDEDGKFKSPTSPNVAGQINNIVPNWWYTGVIPAGASANYDNAVYAAIGDPGQSMDGQDATGFPQGWDAWFNNASMLSNNKVGFRTNDESDVKFWPNQLGIFFMEFNVGREIYGSIPVNRSIIISDPYYNFLNPNYTSEDYDNFTSDAMQNKLVVGGVDYSTAQWVSPIVSSGQQELIYKNSGDTAKKYMVVHPIEYAERLTKLNKTGQDSNGLITIGGGQVVSPRHKFPLGTGSANFEFDSRAFTTKSAGDALGYPTNINTWWDLSPSTEDETWTIKQLTLEQMGGDVITIQFYDEKGEVVSGQDGEGISRPLPPIKIPAPNLDKAGNPLKARTSIQFGF